jgi:small subunit ribosomal protein S9
MTTPHTYFYSIGRRKTATAQVRLFSGKGESTINGLPVDKYINRADLFQVIYSPLKVA